MTSSIRVIAVALAVLALNLFVLGPAIRSQLGDVAAQVSFVLIRVAVVVGVSWLMTRRFGWKRFRAISLVSCLIFVDQVLFRALLLAADSAGVPWGAAFYGLAMSFITAYPMIFLLAFLGAQAGNEWGRRHPSS